MANIIQRRRGTTLQHSSFQGAEGEITIDLDKKTVVVHDGTTIGGFPLAKEDLGNVTNAVGVQQLNLAEGSNGQVLVTDGAGTISFSSSPNLAGLSVGGDIEGTLGNMQIKANSVGINELDLVDGTAGQVLQTDGAGNISFGSTVDISTAAVGGDLSGTVGNAQLVVNSVTTTELAGDAVETVNVKDENITTAKLAPDAVTTIKILNNAVTDPKIASMSASKLTGALPNLDGSNLTNLTLPKNPYDISFIAGFDADTQPTDLVDEKVYGTMVMARSGTIEGAVGHITDAPVGSFVQIQILLNGANIYSVNPNFADGANVMTDGTLSTTTFASGDLLEFKVTNIGSTTAGGGLKFMFKCLV